MYGGDAENAFSLLASSFLFHEICFISRDAALRVAKALLHSEYIIDDIFFWLVMVFGQMVLPFRHFLYPS